MKCKSCSKQIEDHSLFCNFCGSKVEKEPVCPQCGITLAKGSLFCNKCGAKVVEMAPVAAKKQDIRVTPWEDFEYEEGTLPGRRIIKKYTGSDTTVYIPGGTEVIGDSAFSDNDTVECVIIGPGVTHIQAAAFSFCSSLTSIKMPNSIERIDDSVFSYCCCLTDITLPENLKKLDFCLFDCCKSLTSIVIPDSVTEFDATAFSGCINLKEYIYRGKRYSNFSDVQTVVNGSLGDSGETPLEQFEYKQTSNGIMIIRNKSKAIEIHIPRGVTEIGYTAFNMDHVQKVTIPEGVTELQGAFYRCEELTDVSIPDSVVSIRGEFGLCEKLKNITYKGKVYTYETLNELFKTINR